METAPFLAELSGGPDGGAAYWLTASDGVRVRAGVWPAGQSKAKGTIFIFTGRAEFVEKYGWTVADFAKAGFAGVTVDWRGQGLADRLHDNPAYGHVGRFRDYQLDVAAFIDMAQRQDLPRPWFVLGHSMGGAIALRSIVETTHFKAAAFSAPMWGIKTSRFLETIKWPLLNSLIMVGRGDALMLGQIDRAYVTVAPFLGNGLTSWEPGWEHFKALVDAEPRLALGGPTTHWVREALRETAYLARVSLPQEPAYVGMGTDDTTNKLSSARHNVERWPGSKLEIFQGARHELMIEAPEIRNTFVASVIDHFERALVPEAELA